MEFKRFKYGDCLESSEPAKERRADPLVAYDPPTVPGPALLNFCNLQPANLLARRV